MGERKNRKLKKERKKTQKENCEKERKKKVMGNCAERKEEKLKTEKVREKMR